MEVVAAASTGSKSAPKRNPRAEVDVQHGACASPFYTITQFCRRNPVFTPNSLRWIIFKAGENGLDASGALLRNGRSIIVDEPKFFEWFRARGQRAA